QTVFITIQRNQYGNDSSACSSLLFLTSRGNPLYYSRYCFAIENISRYLYALTHFHFSNICFANRDFHLQFFHIFNDKQRCLVFCIIGKTSYLCIDSRNRTADGRNNITIL